MIRALVVALLASGSGLSFASRVDGERAVERARYRFVIGATTPFDEVYPRSVFEKKVAREIAEERLLSKFFEVTITPEVLATEFDRIQRDTKAPDQWAAIKAALGNDRSRIEEVFCRPLLVERALRAKFAFDPEIHAGPHRKAREARARLLTGKNPEGLSILVLARAPTESPTTSELLGKARAESAAPRVLDSPGRPSPDGAAPIDPEMAAVLERELKKPGDVTTILEERDRFSVFRLKEKTAKTWKIEAVTFSKVDFEAWFEEARQSP